MRDTGYITLDSGYMNTGSCESQITYLDGDKGILRYRGYDIADLAANCRVAIDARLLAPAFLSSPAQPKTATTQ